MQVFLSKLWKGVALFLVCVMVGVTFMPYLVFENNADAKKTQNFELRAATSLGSNGNRGSADNPFTILEIVPYHDMAQMIWLSEETMPKLESEAVYKYRSETNKSTFKDGLSGLCSSDEKGEGTKFDQKIPVVERTSFSKNVFSQSIMYLNKPQKNYSDNDFAQILKMFGYTGTTYFNGDTITTDGKEKAIKLIKNFRTTGQQQQRGDNFDVNSDQYYETRIEKIHNHEIFKRMIIGIESDVVKEEWARRKLIQEGVTNPNPADISAKVAAFSISTNSAEYVSIRNEKEVKERVLQKCDSFHVRVIVATPDEVNRSVANPSSAVDTVAVFPEKMDGDVYKTYTPNSNQSLIGMADLVFYVDKFTNTETGYMYDYFAKDATKRSTPTAKCPNYYNINYNGMVGNHYKYDLTGKAAYEMFTRMVGGTTGTQKKLPVIISITSYNQTNIWNSHDSNHNIAKIMYLEYAYLFNDVGFNASTLLGRMSYETGAGYNGADSPASDNAYKLKFKFDNGTIKDRWGGGDFFEYRGSSTPTRLCGVHYLPYQNGFKNPVENGNLGVLNGSVFIFNADENFNGQIVQDKFSNTGGQFQATEEYIANKQIVTYYGETGKLTPADVIMAILGFEGSVQALPHNILRVLEIQPCASFEKEDVSNEEERKRQLEEMYRKILPNYIGPITIDQMSSIEFNGMVDDIIENYDLIYFGMRTGRLNTNSSGNTIYNDTSLNGKIYLHTGDYIPLGRGVNANTNPSENKNLLLRGSLSMTKEGELTHAGDDGKDRSDIYRYAGNDITKIKRNSLIDYVKSGHCVVFDKSFFETDSAGNIVMGRANDNKVDNASYIYDFVQFCAKENTESNTYEYVGSSVFGVDFTNSSVGIGNNLETALARAPYVEIKMISGEPEYAEGTPFSGSGFSAADGLKTVTNTSRELNFVFEIYTANVSGNFKAELYVDGYHDGNFNPEDLLLTMDGIYTGDALTGAAPVGGATTITVSLTSDFTGMVPWKLLVYEESADADMAGLKRASKTGYTAVKRTSDEIETINVLQILSSQRHTGSKGSVDLIGNGKFRKYAADNVLGPAVGYNIKITQVYIDDLLTDPNFFANVSNASELDDTTKNAFLAKDANNKNKYDMLLLGFDDGYGFKNYTDDIGKQEIVLKAIDQYINAGYAVLLSHDNLSFYNYRADPGAANRDAYYSGYYVNYMLREKLAADRYGVYLKEEARTDKDVPYKAGSATTANPDGVPIENLDDWNSVSRADSKGGRPTPLYNRTQIQGITDSTLDTIAYRCGAKGRGWKLSNNFNGGLNFAGDPNGKTQAIKQTNKGQVTLFPYVIDEEYDNTSFPVADTHCQYYQLDMERPDLVVWYTLDNSNISSYYGHNGPDPRNNYYIYNTKNITYTGMGHSGGVSDKEVKLFINTMIAAYRAAKVPAYSILRNDGAATSTSGSEKQYLYVDYDTFSDISGSATIISADLAKDPETGENCIKVLFSVLDNNMMFNKKIYISPVVFSHTTKGNVSRTSDTGIYTSMGNVIGPTAYSSIDNYRSAELTSGSAIALYTQDIRTNVYEVNNDGSIGAQVEYENVRIGSNTATFKAIPVQHSQRLTASTKKYCTYLPLKYFKEEGVNYNEIYLSLSCMILHGQDDDRQALYGDGNIVCISKRELFDLR